MLMYFHSHIGRGLLTSPRPDAAVGSGWTAINKFPLCALLANRKKTCASKGWLVETGTNYSRGKHLDFKYLLCWTSAWVSYLLCNISNSGHTNTHADVNQFRMHMHVLTWRDSRTHTHSTHTSTYRHWSMPPHMHSISLKVFRASPDEFQAGSAHASLSSPGHLSSHSVVRN